jgi:hypothetical protein
VSRLQAIVSGIGVALLLSGIGQAVAAPPTAAPRIPRQLAAIPWQEIDGALPAGLTYHYNDNWHGWPVAPLHGPHTIRGGFLDPRGLSGYHFGIDIDVDDNHPVPGAPAIGSQPFYAVEGGSVRVLHIPKAGPLDCNGQRLEIAHFSYWHVVSTVALHQHVSAGQQIGWTCRGEGHLHLSEWTRWNGRQVWVNPLHAGGKLAPQGKNLPPQLLDVWLVRPSSARWCPPVSLTDPDGTTRLDSRSLLRGLVEVRAAAESPQAATGFVRLEPYQQVPISLYGLGLTIQSLSSGRVVLAHVTFRADRLPAAPLQVHYAPGTRENLASLPCDQVREACGGVYVYRPLSGRRIEYLDTAALPAGEYAIHVWAWTMAGLTAERTLRIRIAKQTFAHGLLYTPRPLRGSGEAPPAAPGDGTLNSSAWACMP